jgi:hypothetical protein
MAKQVKREQGFNALEAGEKLARLKKLVVELQREIPAESEHLERIGELAAELNKAVLDLDVRVAPKLIGKEAALLPVMY